MDLLEFGQNIPHFRGVFMRNTLPKTPKTYECGIVNLDTSSGPGSHWVAYFKRKKHVEYFDSFGNLQPPVEIRKYLGNNIVYNHERFQKFNTVICGHLCIKFLLNKRFD